ncbi:MAG: hypothetical protein JWM80_5189, partial [Cyanobacteria bacterium RYN_339]|nr:hypothetical protein [Cyanobacteria bacterium RYN_339]
MHIVRAGLGVATLLNLLAGCQATAPPVAPAASEAPGPAASLKPTSSFIPAANVKANPAVGLALGTAAVSPT